MDVGGYHVVHIVTNGEYKTPLVASQVFDRAQAQATIQGKDKPASVSVWIMAPMRDVYNKDARKIVHALRKRCPDVKIEMAGGIGKLKNWPAIPTIKRFRQKLKSKTVYHCRGESSFQWGYHLKKFFPQDAVIIDIRGYWPLERLINADITDEAQMSPAQERVYETDVKRLQYAVQNSNGLFTVSEPLRRYLIDHIGAPEDSVMIPCCVKDTIPDDNRTKIRQELNIQDKTAILYLGGTQKYQHLEDLVMPFISSALRQSDKCAAVFITQNKEKMSSILSKFQISPERVRLISLAQEQVADYLTAMDVGLLLRAPSKLNNFSQPVKFGEYLSAGIPVVLEEGTGDISRILDAYKIGCVVKLTGKVIESDFDKEVEKALDWYQLNKNEVRINTKKCVEDCYTWKANVQKERSSYVQALRAVQNN